MISENNFGTKTGGVCVWKDNYCGTDGVVDLDPDS
jgi:hypothetical protein